MLKNYFKFAWRNITKYKVYATINVVGLALGMCACIIIYLIVSHEFSFDRFHPARERIYRITGEFQRADGSRDFLNSIVPEIAGVQTDIPGFEAKAGIHFYYGKVVIPETSLEFETGNDVVVTWPDYFRIFYYDWLAGDPSTALTKPYSVVLTEKKARKYFGQLAPDKMLGKSIVYNDSLQVSVTGIIKAWTKNSDLPYTDFISVATVSNNFLKKTIPTDDWRSLEPHRSMTFVKLEKKASAKQINARLATYVKQHIKPNDHGTLAKMELQPLSRVHFSDRYDRGDDGDGFRKAHLPTLLVLICVAVFILLIAIVNFINLSTAQSVQRLKEVGVRKILGSSRISLVVQFLIETLLLTLFAVGVALFLVKPVLSGFRSFLPPEIEFDINLQIIIFSLLIAVVTSVLAGLYPARVLSSYVPALIIKRPATMPSGGINLRKALISFQFTISLVFIIGAIIITRQINFMHSKEKGFSEDNIITIENWGDRTGKMKVLMEKIRQLPGIEKAIMQGTAPMGFAESSGIFSYKGQEKIDMRVALKFGNENFIPFYQMKIVAGRNIVQSDNLKELVINEAFAKSLGFTRPADVIGKFLYAGDNRPFPIVGVVADFHMGSFRDPIRPAIIAHMPEFETNIAIRLVMKEQQEGDIKATLSQIDQQWRLMYPEGGFNYSFLNEYISRLFEKDQQMRWLINASMIITIFISCMGLFGLAMFTAERRTKEIGIRKVLGATVTNIITLLYKDFALLVLISALIASPIAWYFAMNWLNDFEYRISIGWWVFLLAAGIAFLISLLTVSYQAIKAAISHPVKSLRVD